MEFEFKVRWSITAAALHCCTELMLIMHTQPKANRFPTFLVIELFVINILLNKKWM